MRHPAEWQQHRRDKTARRDRLTQVPAAIVPGAHSQKSRPHRHWYRDLANNVAENRRHARPRGAPRSRASWRRPPAFRVPVWVGLFAVNSTLLVRYQLAISLTFRTERVFTWKGRDNDTLLLYRTSVPCWKPEWVKASPGMQLVDEATCQSPCEKFRRNRPPSRTPLICLCARRPHRSSQARLSVTSSHTSPARPASTAFAE
jgi:hypothetical protein